MRLPSNYRYDDSDGFQSMAGGRRYPHTGIDFFSPIGGECFAILDATVTATGWHDGNGNYVAIQLPDGTFWSYIHLSEILVSEGQHVSEGQVIARSGDTGTNCRGAHLHCSHSDSPRVYVGLGNLTDPWAYLQGSGAPSTLAVDGDFGPATKRALQRALGVTADGDFGPVSTRALQAFLGITQDGDWGRQTSSALQSFLGVTVDGDFGPASTRALQERLNAGTFVQPAPAPTPEVKPSEPTPAPETVTPAKPEPEAPAPAAPAAPKPPKKEKPVKHTQKEQTALTASIQPTDLGSIISNPRIRKIVWSVYGLTGLVFVAVGGGLTATHLLAPEWYMFALGAFTAVAPAFSGLAVANIKTGEESK